MLILISGGQIRGRWSLRERGIPYGRATLAGWMLDRTGGVVDRRAWMLFGIHIDSV